MTGFDLITNAKMASKTFRVWRLEGAIEGWKGRGWGQGVGQLRGAEVRPILKYRGGSRNWWWGMKFPSTPPTSLPPPRTHSPFLPLPFYSLLFLLSRVLRPKSVHRV